MTNRLARLVGVCAVSAAGVVFLHAQTSPKPSAFPAAGEPAAITVLAAGAQPRSALRYAIARDYKEQLEMTTLINMALSMGAAGSQSIQMPNVRMTADLATTNVTPAGDVSYDITFTGMKADPFSGADPNVVATMQGFEADFKNLRGSATITPRGVTRDVHFDTSKMANPQMAQILDSVSASVNGLSIPLPEEAVGVGARWEARQTVDAGGFKQQQKSVWQLVSADGKSVKLSVTIDATAPPQPVVNPMMPPGADVRLESMTSSGSGTVTLHLNSLVPTSEMNTKASTTMSINMGGASQQVIVDATTKVNIAPARPARLTSPASRRRTSGRTAGTGAPRRAGS